MRIGGRSSVVLVCVSALVVGACGGDDGGEVARATVPVESSTSSSAVTTSSSTSSTVPAPVFEPLLADPGLSLEEQVEAAYLFYWEVVLDAFARGDGEHLSLVLVREGLDHRSAELAQLVANGQRFEGAVDHDFVVTVHSDTEATVVDAERSHISTIDSATGEVIATDDGEVAMWMYTLVKQEDRWLVDYFVVYRDPSSSS